ncbi:MAG: peptidase M48, partial [Gemmatimonadota bacterium]
TDPTALNRQPNHIRLVTLPRGMTLEEFYRSYPSVVPVEQVALINGLVAGQVIPRGTIMKQIR